MRENLSGGCEGIGNEDGKCIILCCRFHLLLRQTLGLPLASGI